MFKSFPKLNAGCVNSCPADSRVQWANASNVQSKLITNDGEPKIALQSAAIGRDFSYRDGELSGLEQAGCEDHSLPSSISPAIHAVQSVLGFAVPG